MPEPRPADASLGGPLPSEGHLVADASVGTIAPQSTTRTDAAENQEDTMTNEEQSESTPRKGSKFKEQCESIIEAATGIKVDEQPSFARCVEIVRELRKRETAFLLVRRRFVEIRKELRDELGEDPFGFAELAPAFDAGVVHPLANDMLSRKIREQKDEISMLHAVRSDHSERIEALRALLERIAGKAKLEPREQQEVHEALNGAPARSDEPRRLYTRNRELMRQLGAAHRALRQKGFKGLAELRAQIIRVRDEADANTNNSTNEAEKRVGRWAFNRFAEILSVLDRETEQPMPEASECPGCAILKASLDDAHAENLKSHGAEALATSLVSKAEARAEKMRTALETALPILTLAVHVHEREADGSKPDAEWAGTCAALKVAEAALAEPTESVLKEKPDRDTELMELRSERQTLRMEKEELHQITQGLMRTLRAVQNLLTTHSVVSMSTTALAEWQEDMLATIFNGIQSVRRMPAAETVRYYDMAWRLFLAFSNVVQMNQEAVWERLKNLPVSRFTNDVRRIMEEAQKSNAKDYWDKLATAAPISKRAAERAAKRSGEEPAGKVSDPPQTEADAAWEEAVAEDLTTQSTPPPVEMCGATRPSGCFGALRCWLPKGHGGPHEDFNAKWPQQETISTTTEAVPDQKSPTSDQDGAELDRQRLGDALHKMAVALGIKPVPYLLEERADAIARQLSSVEFIGKRMAEMTQGLEDARKAKGHLRYVLVQLITQLTKGDYHDEHGNSIHKNVCFQDACAARDNPKLMPACDVCWDQGEVWIPFTKMQDRSPCPQCRNPKSKQPRGGVSKPC